VHTTSIQAQCEEFVCCPLEPHLLDDDTLVILKLNNNIKRDILLLDSRLLFQELELNHFGFLSFIYKYVGTSLPLLTDILYVLQWS